MTNADNRTLEDVRVQLEDAIGRVIFLDYDTAPSGTIVGRARFLQEAADAVFTVLVLHRESEIREL